MLRYCQCKYSATIYIVLFVYCAFEFLRLIYYFYDHSVVLILFNFIVLFIQRRSYFLHCYDSDTSDLHIPFSGVWAVPQ